MRTLTTSLWLATTLGTATLAGGCGGNDGPAQIVVDDDTYQFDPVRDSSSSSAVTFKFTNRGGHATQLLTSDIAGNDFAAFTIVTDECRTRELDAGQSCHVQVALTSRRAGDFAATLRVHADVGGVASVDLSGHVDEAELSISGAMLDFGAIVSASQAAAERTFTIHNDGGASSGVLQVTPPSRPGFSITHDGCSGLALDGGASCSVSVTFTPASAATGGSFADSISYTAIPGGGVTASLQAEDLLPALQLPDVAFGTLPRGTMSTTQLVTLSNSGGKALTIDAALFNGGDSSQFGIDSAGCINRRLLPQTQCTMTLYVYAPLSSAATTWVSTLLVSAHDDQDAPLSVLANVSASYPAVTSAR